MGGPSVMRGRPRRTARGAAPPVGDERQIAQLAERVAQFARIAHVDREALRPSTVSPMVSPPTADTIDCTSAMFMP
jgi:hypothetical protein